MHRLVRALRTRPAVVLLLVLSTVGALFLIAARGRASAGASLVAMLMVPALCSVVVAAAFKLSTMALPPMGLLPGPMTRSLVLLMVPPWGSAVAGLILPVPYMISLE